MNKHSNIMQAENASTDALEQSGTYWDSVSKISLKLYLPIPQATISRRLMYAVTVIAAITFPAVLACSATIDKTPLRDLPLSREANKEFVETIRSNFREGKDLTLIAGETWKAEYNGKSYEVTKSVEFVGLSYQLFADTAPEQTTSDKLNGVKNPEWQGTARIKASAFHIISKTPSKEPGQLWDYEAHYMDGKWHDFKDCTDIPQLPLIGCYRIEKNADGWKIQEAPDAKWRIENLVAEGALISGSSNAPVLAAPSSNSADEVKQAFGKYNHSQSKDVVTLIEEDTISVCSYTRKQKTTEFHAPVITVETKQATDAERLNGLEARAELQLEFDSYRIVKILPQPTQSSLVPDGKWHSPEIYGGKVFVATKKDGSWTILPEGPNNEHEKHLLIPK